ncbi:unnamed protein product [Cuscuta epithymum]|uniref:Uncharacterized protein n=1 Tax=Cuscuta epithymum TaxID=186058 RepID=A0AAV0EQK8_9ASTE|nr:unnamed protein product [Cuscuta epithymum]
MHRGDFPVPVLLLALDSSSSMGGSLRGTARSISRHGHGFSRAQAPPVPLPSPRLLAFLAPAFLLLASLLVWSVPQLQGIPIVRRVRDLLWCSVWEEHSVGDTVSIWSHKGSTVRW